MVPPCSSDSIIRNDAIGWDSLSYQVAGRIVQSHRGGHDPDANDSLAGPIKINQFPVCSVLDRNGDRRILNLPASQLLNHGTSTVNQPKPAAPNIPPTRNDDAVHCHPANPSPQCSLI